MRAGELGWRRGYRPGVVERPDDTRLTWLLAVLSGLLLGLAAWRLVREFRGSFDFAIYRTLASYFTDTGHLPAPGEKVGEISGSYADFTPVNLRLYQWMAATDDPRRTFIWYTLAVLLVGVGVLAANRRRLGLSVGSFAALLGALVVCALPMFQLFVDKAAFFTATLIAAVCVERAGWRAGAALALLFGWTGLGALAVPLCVLRGSRRERVEAAVAAVVLSLGMWLCAGGAVSTLVANRFDRENGEPFWYSAWHLVPVWSPTLRTAVLVAVSAWIGFRFWRGRVSGAAAVVALVFLNLLVSNNTDVGRVVIVLPLGVLCLRRDAHRIVWAVAVSGWALIAYLDATGRIAVMDDSTPAGWRDMLWVIAVNAPLAVGVAASLHDPGATSDAPRAGEVDVTPLAA